LNDGTDIGCNYEYSPTFDYFAPAGKKITYNLFSYLVVEDYIINGQCCLPGFGGLGGASQVSSPAENAQGYYILHRAEVDIATNKLSDPTNPGCFYLLPAWNQWTCDSACVGIQGCGGGGAEGESISIGARYSGPQFVGEITEADLIQCNGVPHLKTLGCAAYDYPSKTPDQIRYCIFPSRNFGGCDSNGWSFSVANAIVSTNSAITAEDRLNRESWVWDYYIGPKTCSNGCDLTDSGRNCNDTAGCKFSDDFCSAALRLRGQNQGVFTDGGYLCSDLQAGGVPQSQRRKIILKETQIAGITAIEPYVYKIVSATDPSWTEAINPNEIVWYLRGDAATSFDDLIISPTKNSFHEKLTNFDAKHEVIAYYTDGSVDSNFETSPPVYTEIYKNSSEKYDIPTIDFGVKEFAILNNKLYINASAVCDATKPTSCFIAQNGNSKIIITSNGWELGPWKFDLWYPNKIGKNFKYEGFGNDVDNGNQWSDQNGPVQGFNYTADKILDDYQTPITNQDGSTDIQIKFWITLTAMFKKQIDGVDVYTYSSRVKQFGVTPSSINSGSVPFTSTFKNKLLTDEITGTSQCVSINCDTAPYICEAYPDC
jgi:hypothetical protein